jgi:hypothetical protein
MGQFHASGPSLLSPYPALTVLPAFLLGSFRFPSGAVLVPTVVFYSWIPGAFRGDGKIPRRSYALLVAATLLSVLEYQGLEYTRTVCIANLVWITCLWALFARNLKKEPNFTINLGLHFVLFAWLAWYAFPYLGELP